MDMTHALLGEHGVIYALLNETERAAREETDAGALRAVARMLHAALEPHARIENEVLFTALEPAIGEAGPLACMRHEHTEIESALDEACRADDLETIQRSLRQVILVARDHFAKEENVLFPMARQAIGQAALEGLAGQWASDRKVTVVG